ncbi:MAG: hypothetical protein EBV06_05875 [Planctomycetia bacterium]|nr:hypothetical protein [Planctomycetia bacterium]
MSELPPTYGRNRWWRLALIALVVWQGWLTLGLFGLDPWRQLLSDDPVVSGRHPLHLYHGFLGARTWCERGNLTCYDPAFHAGYPKTPVFDSGSRPAELALALMGGKFCPSSYKIGLASICLAVPCAVYVAARGLHLSRATGVLAVLLVQLVWWGRPGRDAIEAGDGDLLLGSLAAIVQAGLLVRYHDKPGSLSLIGLVIAGLIGWFAHPLLMALMLPPYLVYYLAVGSAHGTLWHLPLFGSLAVALVGNAFWLTDLLGFWWLRVVPDLDTPLITKLTVGGLLQSDLWGDTFDRTICGGLLLLCMAGLSLMHRGGQAIGARLVGAASCSLFLLAIVGLVYDRVGRLGAAQLIVPALIFACLPVACLTAAGFQILRRRHFLAPTAFVLSVLVIAYFVVPISHRERAAQLIQTRPLSIGLGVERSMIVSDLRTLTTSDARILWEDRPSGRHESRWTALLPILTERSFVGGLDAGAGIEHTATGLVEGSLANRPMDDWSDSELDDYCQRYNISWVVTRTPASRERFIRWTGSTGRELLGGLNLFTLKRSPSFALTGAARFQSADTRGIVISDARPVTGDDGIGTLELSLHYQSGMRVSPSRVKIEQKLTTHDTIPFVRLRMKEPAGRILITWP